MQIIGPDSYNSINSIANETTQVTLIDHLGGFDSTFHCNLLDILSHRIKSHCTIETEYIFTTQIKENYPNFNFVHNSKLWHDNNYISNFQNYNQHPTLTFQNFVCSFNGSDHLSRKLLVSILERFKYFTPEYCSKNFAFTVDKLDGHIFDYVSEHSNFYRKFFIANDSEFFFQSINSFKHVQYDHAQNIYNLESKLTGSFLHIVSETMATSYVPFVTEKFFYSIVTRGLFLSYAQPGWHDHVEKYYGFKRYTKLFDYRFDSIKNPVERLVELITMISKFNALSANDWADLYLLEQDTIEYNYNHYFSGNYLTTLKNFEHN
jgi:hypothetical protein